MKYIKYIAIIWFFVMGLLFVGKNDKTIFHVKTEKKSTENFQQNNRINVDAFVQKSSVQKQSVNRFDFSSDAKWYDDYFDLSASDKSNARILTLNFGQDINRCQKVSLLLFPYHLFW